MWRSLSRYPHPHACFHVTFSTITHPEARTSAYLETCLASVFVELIGDEPNVYLSSFLLELWIISRPGGADQRDTTRVLDHCVGCREVMALVAGGGR
jgi:hypothetical protein